LWNGEDARTLSSFLTTITSACKAIGQPQDWKVVLMEGIQLAREMWRVQEGETLPPAEEVIRELREERLVQLTGLC